MSAHPGTQRLLAWFRAGSREPFDFQRETWQAYLDGRSGFIQAPTGMGKTLAAAGGPVIEWMDDCGAAVPAAGAGETPAPQKKRRALTEKQRSATSPLALLWITPLRALAADTVESLRDLASALKLPWSIELRTSDTSATTRKRQRDRLPTVLVTTPESLSLLLSYPGVAERFASLRSIVVDEWHELMSTKRGVQTELGLARMRRLRPDLRVWGLSATIANPAEAAAGLLGPKLAETAAFIVAPDDKAIEVESLRPPDITRFPWAGHLGLQGVEQVAKQIEAARTTLVFTNTRSQAEIWFRALQQARPDWLDKLAVHHGSIDKKIRLAVEQMLRTNQLRAAVCTSSLDLGVDFWPVDQVIQIGSPKSVARVMQRAGRSGHQPGATSRLFCLPTQAFELVEFSAARRAVEARRVEPREPIKLALDVLAQHVVTIAAGDGFDERELLDEVRSTLAYAGLSDEEWQWVMDFAHRGGPTLKAYPNFARIVTEAATAASPALGTPSPSLALQSNGEGNDEPRWHGHVLMPVRSSGPREHGNEYMPMPSGGKAELGLGVPGGSGPSRWVIASERIARAHRASIGTITSDGMVSVRFVTGRTLGSIEESFIARLRPGDTFIFSGRTLEFRRLHDMVAHVKTSTRKKAAIPRWGGGRLPLSASLADEVCRRLDEAATGVYGDAEMLAVRPILELQARWSGIPRLGELQIESTQTRDGHHHYLYPFLGRLVHEGLAALLAYRFGLQGFKPITAAFNDYGVELLCPSPLPLSEDAYRAALAPANLLDDILAALNTGELARRHFREIARIAGLLVPPRPGAPRSARQLQASSGLFYDVFAEHDPENLLLKQAKREVLERQLEFGRMNMALTMLAEKTIVFRQTARLTPMAFPLWAERIASQTLKFESARERIERIAQQLEAAARETPPLPCTQGRGTG